MRLQVYSQGPPHVEGKQNLIVSWPVEGKQNLIGKGIDFTSSRTSSSQASRPYETVPIGTISSPSEGGRKPQGENHQALAVKGERHPTCGQSRTQAAARTRTQAVAVRGGRVTTTPPSLKVHLHWPIAKTLFFFDRYRCSVWTLNWIPCEPNWKLYRFRFRSNINGLLLDLLGPVTFMKREHKNPVTRGPKFGMKKYGRFLFEFLFLLRNSMVQKVPKSENISQWYQGNFLYHWTIIRHHQKSKTGVSVALQKRTNVLQIFLK